jgi:Golgi apparatus protein 1
MIFRGDIWRGGFQMFVSIYDEDDINNDDHVDDLYAQERLNPGQSISEREYTGSRSNSHITFSFSISCDSNFYGSDCATYCVPTNNNQGHYWCDSSTGEKRCRPGWTDPDNNCLTPVCATNCHVVGGYCNPLLV